jgi:hypothetical protein
MSHSVGNCLDSDNESLATQSGAESGDELVLSASRKLPGEGNKKRQIIPHLTVSFPKPRSHTRNGILT